MSKELEDIINAIDKYFKKHDGDVAFHVGLVAFEGKDFKVVDDALFAYGGKKGLLISLEGMIKEIKKEKGKFVNW